MCTIAMTQQTQSKRVDEESEETNNMVATTTTTTTTTVNLIQLATHCIHSTLLASRPIQYLTKQTQTQPQQNKRKGSESDSSSSASTCNISTSRPCSASSVESLEFPSPRIQKRTKTDGTIITDADGLAQRIIYQEIHNLNPYVHVIGEESEAEMQHFLNQMNHEVERELELDLDLQQVGGGEEGFEEELEGANSEASGNQSGSKNAQAIGCTTANSATATLSSLRDEALMSHIQEEMSRHEHQHQHQSEHQDHDQHQAYTSISSTPSSSSSSSSSPSRNSQPIDGIDTDIGIDIDTRRVSVFVDPLDGTSSYAKGNYEAVTILVAIIVDNVPVFGVICKPFAIGTMLHQYLDTNCTVLYGGTLIGGAYVLGGEEMKRSQMWNSNSNNNQHQRRQRSEKKRRDSTSGSSYSTSNSIGKDAEAGTPMNGHGNNQEEPILTCTCTTLPKNIPSADDYEDSSSSSATTSPTASSTSSSSTNTESQSIEINLPYSSNTDFNADLSDNNIQRRAIISKSRAGGVVKKCIDSLSSKELLHPTPMFITGAGYKTMKLVLGEENEALWFFPRPGTSLWDVAAADALLRVMGGRISDKFGNDLDYGRCVHVAKVKGSHPRLEAENEDGIIACCDLELHAKCLELYKEEDWDFGCDS